MRALVTGGAGFIGTNLIKRLLKDGHEVTSIDNYSTGSRDNEQNGCQYISANINNIKFWGRRLEKMGMIPDFIFHMAALPRIKPSFDNPGEVIDTNINGTARILEFAREFDIPLIYAGSSSFHGGKYKNPYTFTKWQGEELCKMYSKLFGVKTTICRFYNVYGDYMPTSGEYRTVLSIFKEQYKNGKPLTITGDGEQRRDFTHVDDIVDGLVKCVDHLSDITLTYEFGRGKNYSMNEVVEMFGSEKVYIDEIPGEARETLRTNDSAWNVLKWEPEINLKEWIKEQL